MLHNYNKIVYLNNNKKYYFREFVIMQGNKLKTD